MSAENWSDAGMRLHTGNIHSPTLKTKTMPRMQKMAFGKGLLNYPGYGAGFKSNHTDTYPSRTTRSQLNLILIKEALKGWQQVSDPLPPLLRRWRAAL